MRSSPPRRRQLNLFRRKERKQLFGRRHHSTRPRLFAGIRERRVGLPDLAELPILGGGQQRRFCDPVSDLRFAREAKPHQPTRNQRVEQQDRATDHIGGEKMALQSRRPRGIGQPDGEQHRAPSNEGADDTLIVAEAVLDVERFPRVQLLVLGEAHAAERMRVALRAHVGEAGCRAALKILRKERPSSTDRRVRVVVRPERADPGTESKFGAHRTVEQRHPSQRRCAAIAGAHAGTSERQDRWQVFGTGPRHHCVHRYFLDREAPCLAPRVGGHAADDLIRVLRGTCEHRLHARFGGKHDWQLVGEAVLTH